MRYPLHVPGLEGRRVEVETARARQGARALLDGAPVPTGAKKGEFLVPRPDGSSALVQLRSLILDPIPIVIVYGGPPPLESASWSPRPNVSGLTGVGVPQTLAEPFAWYEWVRVGLPRAARLAAAFGVSALAFALFIPAALWARAHLFHHDAPAPLYGSGGQPHVSRRQSGGRAGWSPARLSRRSGASMRRLRMALHPLPCPPLRRCLLVLLGTGAVAAGTMSACTAAPTAAASRTEINVRDYGAIGDGTTDDTSAFLKAVQAAKAGGVPVRVPRGTYSVSKTIVVDNVEVIGATSGAWPSDGDALPSILDKVAGGPCFEMRAGGSLHGLNVDYGRARDAHFKYAAILIVGGGVYVSSVRIRGAYDGIAADGIHNVGRLNVENVFMAGIQHEGVRVTGTYDVPRLANVEVWNNGYDKAPFTAGVGFHLGRNDGMRMTDCFAFAMSVGYLFEKTGLNADTLGTTEACLNGCSCDYCPTGILVNGTNWVTISGGFFWCHQSALVVNGAGAKVQVSGTLMKSNGSPCVHVLASDAVVVTGCDLTRPMKEHPGPCVLLTGGTTVLGANYLDAYGNGVEVGAGVDSANVTGNTIVARGGQGVVAAPGAKSVAANNVVVVE